MIKSHTTGWNRSYGDRQSVGQAEAGAMATNGGNRKNTRARGFLRPSQTRNTDTHIQLVRPLGIQILIETREKEFKTYFCWPFCAFDCVFLGVGGDDFVGFDFFRCFLGTHFVGGERGVCWSLLSEVRVGMSRDKSRFLDCFRYRIELKKRTIGVLSRVWRFSGQSFYRDATIGTVV